MRRIAVLFLVFGGLATLAGCGSGSGVATSTTPTPTVGTVANPGNSTSPTTYQAALVIVNGHGSTSGQRITLNTGADNGAGTVTLRNFGANMLLTLRFCPYPGAFANCINITTFTPDASGNADANFQFAPKGTFSGVFDVTSNGSEILIGATQGEGIDSTALNFRSALLPAGSVTGGIAQTAGNPSGAGSVTITGSTVHLTLTAAPASHTFTAAVCSITPNSTCISLGSVTTDAQGNASTDLPLASGGAAGIIRLTDSGGTQFITAFRVQ